MKQADPVYKKIKIKIVQWINTITGVIFNNCFHFFMQMYCCCIYIFILFYVLKITNILLTELELQLSNSTLILTENGVVTVALVPRWGEK